MPAHLLDTNVLIALAWPTHQHHAAAHRWFASAVAADDRWATCPMTQCAFVRVSTNPRAVGGALTPAEATGAIARMTADARHVFWPDDLPVASPHFPAARLRGHQQITDAYLLALCASRGGRLATFDAAIATLADAAGLVMTISP